MSETTGQRVPLLLTPGSQVATPSRRGYGVAATGGSTWSGRDGIEQVNDALLGAYPMSGTSYKRQHDRRVAARVEWAYKSHYAYASCVDLIAGAMLANGEQPERRGWRVVPARDHRDEPIKNPDERQLEPWFQFVGNCHRYKSFDSLLAPIVVQYVAANHVYAEIALSQLVNPDGEKQPGGLYHLPQAQIYPKVDDHGELDDAFPFWQLRPGQAPKPYRWSQVFWATFDATLQNAGVNPMAPVDTLITPITSAIQAEKFILSYFSSGAKLGTIFKAPKMDEDEALDFLRWLKEHFMDSEKGHQPYVLFGDMEIADPPKTFQEFAQFFELQKQDVNKTCGRFRTDPRLISAQSQGSALGNKGEREHVWRELLLGPVNERKVSFSAHVTKQFLREGFGITDWNFELVPYRDHVDADRMANIATAYKTAGEAGIFNWKKLTELNQARHRIDSNMPERTQEELDLDAAAGVEAAPAPGLLPPGTAAEATLVQDTALNGAQIGALNEIILAVAEGKLPPESAIVEVTIAFPTIDESEARKLIEPAAKMFADRPEPVQAQPAPVKAEDEEPPAAEGKRAARSVTVRKYGAALDGWSDDVLAELLPEMHGALDKGVAALASIYERVLVEGFTKELKKEFDEVNILPGSGVSGSKFRKALKDHYAAARAAAEQELGATGARAATGTGPATMGTWINAFGEHAFDDVHESITRKARGLMLTGLKSGWDLGEFVAQVKSAVPEHTEAQVERVVRTASNEIFNIGRQNIAEESGDVVAYRFLAIPEKGRTCKTCMAADGLEVGIHSPDADRLRPPLHPNCRCILSFVKKGEPWKTDARQVTAVLKSVSPAYGGEVTESKGSPTAMSPAQGVAAMGKWKEADSDGRKIIPAAVLDRAEAASADDVKKAVADLTPVVKTTTRSVDSLVGVQDSVSADTVKDYMKQVGSGEGTEPITVYKWQGENHVIDGHHRAVAHKLAGKKKIKVELHDFDAAKTAAK